MENNNARLNVATFRKLLVESIIIFDKFKLTKKKRTTNCNFWDHSQFETEHVLEIHVLNGIKIYTAHYFQQITTTLKTTYSIYSATIVDMYTE